MGKWDRDVRRPPIKGVLLSQLPLWVTGTHSASLGKALASSIKRTFSKSSYVRGKGVGVFMHQLVSVMGEDSSRGHSLFNTLSVSKAAKWVQVIRKHP